jgi:hypothetical protein
MQRFLTRAQCAYDRVPLRVRVAALLSLMVLGLLAGRVSAASSPTAVEQDQQAPIAPIVRVSTPYLPTPTTTATATPMPKACTHLPPELPLRLCLSGGE